MKTQFAFTGRPPGGYALLLTLFMVAISIIILTATMNRTSTDSMNNERNNQYTKSVNAAEAATELAVAQMRLDYPLGGDARITNHMGSYRTSLPLSTDNPYWSDYQFSDGQGTAGQIYVSCISNRTYRALSGQYMGLNGFAATYRVLANARDTTARYNITGAVQQDVDLNAIPVFQFAVFFNGLLEFTWAAPLTIRGRTHANGNIHLGSAWPLVFNDLVTTTGVAAITNWWTHTLPDYTSTVTFATNISGGYTFHNPTLNLPVGTNNTPAAVREIVNIPPSGEAVNTSIGQQRFYNKAGMDLLISNNTVTAIIKNDPADGSPVTITANYFPTNNSPTNFVQVATNFPFLTLTNTFKDQREGNWAVTSQIDVGKFNLWSTYSNIYTMPTGGSTKHPPSNPLNILYVADNRTLYATQFASVRLTNGLVLSTNGFTLATPNPIYIIGNYNCTNGLELGTTNTTSAMPAALISDAITLLSPNWQDSLGAGSLGGRNASSMTVNAALIAGMVYSAGATGSAPFSGGAMNFSRLLEDWSGATLTLNTSIVNLYDSVKAVGPWQSPGGYYNAPGTRNFNFDQNFKNQAKLPPGTPMFVTLTRGKWTVPPPNRIDYYGN